MLYLTPREELCLNWAAQGKTSWEIGIILGISERTINYHIGNASSKMDAPNRQAAITRALLGGWITGDPNTPSPYGLEKRLAGQNQKKKKWVS